MSGPPLGTTNARSLRIGIDGRELQDRPTGVGRYLRSLLRRFAVAGDHRFLVYSAAPVDFPVTTSRIESRVLPGGHPLVWEQRTLPAALARDEVDALLSPAYSCPIVSTVPRVTAIHDLSFFARPEEFGFLHGLRRRVMARQSARVSASLLACSQFTRSEISRHLGPGASDKTQVVLLGPDDDLPGSPTRADARVALGIADSVPYIITVGTVFRRRNVDVLIRAVASLRERFPEIRLGIVGENRSHPFEDLAALSASLGCDPAVHLTGFVTDQEVACHYAAADVSVFLSEYEGFGLPTLEAMSRGVPTIVADRGSLNEMFASGSVVVEPEVAAVVASLRSLLENARLRDEVRARGAERARFFSWDRAARETLRVLEQAAR